MAVERLRGDGHVDGNHATGGGEPDAGTERERRLQWRLLREVVARGPDSAADLLRSLKTVKRQLSRLADPACATPLERLRASRDGRGGAEEAERVGALERRIGELEAELAALAEEPSGESQGSLSTDTEDGARRRDEDHSSTPAPVGEPRVAEPEPAVAGMRPRIAPALRRPFPDVVTVEPADDDADVYGAAWPLVEEWRWMREAHPEHGSGVRWLETEARILALELAMLEEYGLTLPPETQPLRGFARRGQTTWRKAALRDTDRALGRARVRRFLTLGLWWK